MIPPTSIRALSYHREFGTLFMRLEGGCQFTFFGVCPLVYGLIADPSTRENAFIDHVVGQLSCIQTERSIGDDPHCLG